MRRLIDRRSAAMLAILALLCAAMFLIFANMPGAAVAVIERDGKVILRQSLNTLSAPKEVKIEGENDIELTVVFYPDGAAVQEADCPDKLCVGFGKLTRAGESAVCLPAKTVLRLEGSKQIDAAAY